MPYYIPHFSTLYTWKIGDTQDTWDIVLIGKKNFRHPCVSRREKAGYGTDGAAPLLSIGASGLTNGFMEARSVSGRPMARYNRTMVWYNSPLRLETISRYVREGRLSEREGALLRGSPAMRGFRGTLWASLAWLENFSPGVTKRWVGDSKKGWKRCVEPAHAKLVSLRIQGRLQKPRFPRPASKDRCQAQSKQAGRQCRNYGKPKPGGGRYPTCHWHGACAAPYGIRAWKLAMKWDGTQHRKMWVRVNQSSRFRGTGGVGGEE
jgi:hypothetical protein